MTRERKRRGSIFAAQCVGPRSRAYKSVRWPHYVQVRHHAHRPELLHRLMSGPIFAQENRVVTEHVKHLLLHQGREPHGRSHVVREDEKRRSKGDEEPRKRKPVQDGTHSVLADPKVEIPTSEVLGRYGS